MRFFRMFTTLTVLSLIFVNLNVLPVKADTRDDVKKLKGMLSSKDNREQENAVRKLVQLGSSALPETIETLRNDKVYLGRMNAAKVLGLIGDPEAVAPLIEALNDEYLLVQQEALISLGCIGKKSVTPEIIDFIQDNTDYFKKLGAMVLGQLGDERAIPLLEEFAASDNVEVVNAATDALRRLEEQTPRKLFP
jgi:HEAT repeat protein